MQANTVQNYFGACVHFFALSAILSDIFACYGHFPHRVEVKFTLVRFAKHRWKGREFTVMRFEGD